ncbi:hypothetical protein RFI_23641 [Reticulomyxa filosa]|uniref:Uncharacterized protein n=1 Tax=Reticulomyxa filosa TaxID=46433 RepID=X6MJU3_RETFI|nr:hypothetical protein RFI_23641 [Reticulomyxa filosa]|eukprot:ETO13727.1 hypothetical protein RFI_23641 [Reticulomyxa filosa]
MRNISKDEGSQTGGTSGNQNLESKINDEIDRQLAQNRSQMSLLDHDKDSAFGGHTILYVGDVVSKRVQLMQSIRKQYFAEVETKTKEEAEEVEEEDTKVKIKE